MNTRFTLSQPPTVDPVVTPWGRRAPQQARRIRRKGRKHLYMRPSKQRSRSKQNRPRTLGNVVNRVFDSSGPEGKVRGTPQQIIDKYLVLARDAQLSNDRVAAENFLQHAEHYTRMLQEAQRETVREQEGRQQESRPQSGQQGGQQGGQQPGQQGGAQAGQPAGQPGQPHGTNGNNPDRRQGERGQSPGTRRDEAGPTAVIEFDDAAQDSGLVETPEMAATAPSKGAEPTALEPRADASAPERPPAGEGKPSGRRRRGPARPADTAGSDPSQASAQASAQTSPGPGAPASSEPGTQASPEPGAPANPQPGPRAPRTRRPRKPAADSAASPAADASVVE